ncbi:MAG: hypothetical protein R2749_18660 [Acidimicrobiales bacterium]
MTTADYSERIPNVDLAGDRKLQRALESWQPHFLDWWQSQGPADFQDADVYLRTAISRWTRRAGPPSTTSRCPSTAGASSWPTPSPAAPSPTATTSASRPGSRCPASTAASCSG